MAFVRVDGYPMDLALTEGHTFPGEVTKYPVEAGADMSDHIRDLPEVITLECIVSDSPSGEIASDPTRQLGEVPASGLLDPNAPLPSADALEHLREAKRRRRPVSVETSLGVFESMAIVDLEVPKDAGKTHGLFFTVRLERINVVENRRTKVRTRSNMAGAGGKGRGKAVASKPIKLDNTIVWQHGVPPGAPWKPGNPVERVLVTYSKRGGLTKDEAIAFGEAVPDSSFITYHTDPGFGVIIGERRAALEADLKRDRQLKLKAVTIPAKRIPIRAGGSAGSLPPGVDTSRFTREPSGADFQIDDFSQFQAPSKVTR